MRESDGIPAAWSIATESEEAFEEVYMRHFPKVVYYARQYLTDGEEARNIAQETFLELWRHRQSIDATHGVVSWLLSVARNKCLNVLRRRLQQHRYSDYLSRVRTATCYEALGDESAGNLVASQLSEHIESVVADMSEKIRETFLLSRGGNMSYARIAEHQGVSVKTVEYRISMALKTLRISLEGYLGVVVATLVLGWQAVEVFIIG